MHTKLLTDIEAPFVMLSTSVVHDILVNNSIIHIYEI